MSRLEFVASVKKAAEASCKLSENVTTLARDNRFEAAIIGGVVILGLCVLSGMLSASPQKPSFENSSAFHMITAPAFKL